MGMLMKVPPEDPGCVMFVFYLLAKPVKSVNIQFSGKNVSYRHQAHVGLGSLS